MTKGRHPCHNTKGRGNKNRHWCHSVLPVGPSLCLWFHLVSALPAWPPSSPPDGLTTGLQAPASDAKTAALQTLINQLLQLWKVKSYTHTCMCTSMYIYMCTYIYTHTRIYAWVHVCIHLYLYLYLYLQVVPLLCLNPDISWMGCFWDCFLQASISLSLPLALTFSLAFLTFANSTSVAKSHGQAIYDEHDNNNIQLQPLFPACLFAKPYANIFSHIILFNPYNPMQAGLLKYLFYKWRNWGSGKLSNSPKIINKSLCASKTKHLTTMYCLPL